MYLLSDLSSFITCQDVITDSTNDIEYSIYKSRNSTNNITKKTKKHKNPKAPKITKFNLTETDFNLSETYEDIDIDKLIDFDSNNDLEDSNTHLSVNATTNNTYKPNNVTRYTGRLSKLVACLNLIRSKIYYDPVIILL